MHAAHAPVPVCVHALPVPLDSDVSLPPRKHAGVQVRSPPLGVLAWVGGWPGVSRVWDSYIYLKF